MTVEPHTPAIVAKVDPSSEVAVTGYLQRAREWLATAVENTGPSQVAAVRAEIATAAEATKQLGLSREIQTDAVEMVRRAEYALGRAIRSAQERGEIRRVGNTSVHVPGVRGSVSRKSVPDIPDDDGKSSANEFFSNQQQRQETYALADAEPEEFEEALKDAKAEGNLSRANLVRKVKGYVPEGMSPAQRAGEILKLAGEGWTSHQMSDRLGVSAERVRRLARDFDISIPADRSVIGQRRVNPAELMETLVIGLEGSASSTDLIDASQLDLERLPAWIESLTDSLQKLNRFTKKIKEIAP